MFSAKNTSIPASGYVLFEAMDDYEEVLICYKPELTTQMLVARWGFKASHATQLRNLRLVVDNKTDFEGIYELLTAGYALNLVGKGNGEPQAFMSRKTGGGNITDGSAVIKEVDGVQPIVWNQLIDYTLFFAAQSTITLEGNTWKVEKASNVNRAYLAYRLRIGIDNPSYVIGHTYFTAASVRNISAGGEVLLSFNSSQVVIESGNSKTSRLNEWVRLNAIIKFTNTNESEQFQVNGDYANSEMTYYAKDFQVVDLTQMFGAGNEPSTVEEFLDRISHYHIADEYAYNAGEVVNYKGVGIKTTNVDGTKTYVRDWSEVMRKYFPDGMTSLNGVKDFFNERKAVRKFGVVDLGTLDWLYHNGVFHFADGYTFPTGKMKNKGEIAIGRYPYVGHIEPSSIKDKEISSHNYFSDSASILVKDSAYTTAESFKAAMAGVLLFYELSEPVEDIFEKPLNLTYTVINGGTETSLATENSTQFEGSIAYNKDYVAVVDELQMQNRVTTIEFENWEN